MKKIKKKLVFNDTILIIDSITKKLISVTGNPYIRSFQLQNSFRNKGEYIPKNIKTDVFGNINNINSGESTILKKKKNRGITTSNASSHNKFYDLRKYEGHKIPQRIFNKLKATK